MLNTFNCPACGRPISAEVMPNTQVECPLCHQIVTVPPMTAPPDMGGPAAVSYAASTGEPPRKGMATAALVCGIIGVICMPPVGIVGFFLGLIASMNARRQPDRYGGRGLAIAGMWTGGASLVVPALLLSILLPSLARARELSKRSVCAANLRGIGTAAATYANENADEWPIPPYLGPGKDMRPGTCAVTYVKQMGIPGSRNREAETTKADTQLPTSRCYWMLIRDGGVSPKQFICPSSDGNPNVDNDPTKYFDFGTYAGNTDTRVAYRQLSYGLQVPFGKLGRPTMDRDSRMPLAADKGWYSASNDGDGKMGPGPGAITATSASSPDDWRKWNSPNHGGFNDGEGQNILYADMHVEFLKRPIEGVQLDNIYTRWANQADASEGNRTQGAVGPWTDYAPMSDTDTLIYP